MLWYKFAHAGHEAVGKEISEEVVSMDQGSDRMICVSPTCHYPRDTWLINCLHHKIKIVYFTIGGRKNTNGKWQQRVMPPMSQRCHCSLQTQSPVNALETVELSLEDHLLTGQNKTQPFTSRIIGFYIYKE